MMAALMADKLVLCLAGMKAVAMVVYLAVN